MKSDDFNLNSSINEVDNQSVKSANASQISKTTNLSSMRPKSPQNPLEFFMSPKERGLNRYPNVKYNFKETI